MLHTQESITPHHIQSNHISCLVSPAIDGAAVGMEVAATGGLATGEADGLDVTSKVTVTLLTTLLE